MTRSRTEAKRFGRVAEDGMVAVFMVFVFLSGRLSYATKYDNYSRTGPKVFKGE